MSDEQAFGIDLGPQNGGTKRFKDADELRSWLKSEFETWMWAAQNLGYGTSPYGGTLHNFITTAMGQLDAARTNDQAARTQYLNAVSNLVSDHYKNNKLYSSESQIGHFLLDLHKNFPQQGIGALDYLYRNVILSSVHAEAMAGLIRGVLFRGGIEGQDAEKASLNDLYGQFAKLSSQGSAELDSLQARKSALEREAAQLFEDAKNSHIETLGKITADATALLAEQKKVLEEVNASGAKEFASTNQAYKEQMHMRGPVEYWKKQASSYLWIAVGLGILFVLSCIAAAYGADKVLDWLLQPSPKPVQGSFEDIPLWKYGVCLIFLGLGMWILRTLLRSCLSYLHLYTDAGQRVVMVQTFLALIQDKADIQPQDREIILRALFRPAKIGLLGKDGEMITVLDAVAKRFGNEKG